MSTEAIALVLTMALSVAGIVWRISAMGAKLEVKLDSALRQIESHAHKLDDAEHRITVVETTVEQRHRHYSRISP